MDSARPQCSGDPSPGAGIHVTRTPNPRASVSSGTLTSITNLATSLARNMDRLSLDEEHYNRQEEWRRQLPESLGEGLRQGLSRLGISLLGKGRGRWQRRSGVCSQPWRGQVPTPGRNQGWCGPSVFLQTKLRLRRGPQPGPHDPGVAAQGHPGAWAPPFRASGSRLSRASSLLPRGIPKASFSREGPAPGRQLENVSPQLPACPRE